MCGFKECGSCRYSWEDRNSFLTDPDLELIGYQVNFNDLESGLFLFNHEVDTCRTTLALRAEEFRDLYQGQIFTERMTGSDKCPEWCFYEHEIGHCKNSCECAYIREILQIVREWPKQA